MNRTMHNSACLRLALVVALFVGAVGFAAEPLGSVNESARDLPVAYEVDVLIVGGSTGAVAAATAAADAGAKVFLAAPRPYLGDDMTATMRLWLEEGETPNTPLAEKVFDDPVKFHAAGRDPNALDFTYQADRESAPTHKDTNPPRKLTNGLWSSASADSVQFDGDVTLTCDLAESQPIDTVRMMVFYRNGGGGGTDFIVKNVAVATSDDGQSWEDIGQIENTFSQDPTTLSLAVNRKARFVRLAVAKSDAVERILLGEIEITAPGGSEPEPKTGRQIVRPMHVKKTLDDALLDSGVEFLYSCLVTGVLRDKAGEPCGIVMANKGGRQAVVADVIIDCTERATVARLAGAEFAPFPAGPQSLRWTVIGGEVQEAENMTARIVDPPFRGIFPNPIGTASGDFQVIEYTLELPMVDASNASWAAAEQQARSLTYHAEQQFTADILFQIPPDAMRGQERSTGPPRGVIPTGAFRPAGVPWLFVLGASADISREQAEILMRPTVLMAIGESIGADAAAEAIDRPDLQGISPQGKPTDSPLTSGDVGELLVGVRPTQELPTISQPAAALPVLGRYDVVVIGGGTTGAPAGIGAGRRGAKTLVVEYLHSLGGVGTTGAISKYYWGNRIGFSATVEDASASWVIEQRKEWWRSRLLEAGADIWFGTMGCGAFLEDGKVKGVVVVTDAGRGVVLADVVIDTTGNSDIAVAAGSGTIYTDHKELAVQGTGLPFRQLGATYTNTDFTITDDTDVVDAWHVFVYAKHKYPEAFDQGQLIDTRERRRIVGDFTMSILDQVNNRTYPDTVVVSYSNFDTHGYTVDPYLELEHPHKVGFRVNIPYRCMLPKGLDGLFVGGLGTSVLRDAVPLTRMQPDLQNQGYALGVAGAMAVASGVELRDVDMRALQEHLIEIGNLPESVLTDADSFPLPLEQIEASVESVKDEYHGVSVLLTRPDVALPLLQEAYAAAEGEHKLIYAHILAVLGDATGLETLAQAVNDATEWDEGWNYRGMGQFGSPLSRLDQLIIALGRTHDKRALPAILPKLDMLDPEVEFSHHRAVALALESIGDPVAAKPLAGLLTTPDMAGYVHHTVQEAIQRDQESPGGTNAVQSRRESLRELSLARALYRCGDYGNVGQQILLDYAEDLRGHFSRHAKAVLKRGEK